MTDEEYAELEKEEARIHEEIIKSDRFQRFINRGKKAGFDMRYGQYCDCNIYGDAVICGHHFHWFYNQEEGARWDNDALFCFLGKLFADHIAEEEEERRVELLGNLEIVVDQSQSATA